MSTTVRGSFPLLGVVVFLSCISVGLVQAQQSGSVLELLRLQGDLSVGAEVNGALSSSDVRGPGDSYLDAWSIEGQPGESITVDLISDDFDPFLYVIGPGFENTFNDDDSGGACYARISLTFLESGTFRIVASSNMARQTGTYVLRVTDTPGPVADYPCGGMNPAELLALPAEQRVLAIGDVAAGVLSAESPTIGPEAKKAEAWDVEGVAGETVTVTLESDAFDSYLYVTGPGLGEVLSDDDSAGDLNSRLTFTFPSDGIYRVVASVLDSGEGAYTISLEDAVGMNELPTEGRVVVVGDSMLGFLSAADPIIDAGRRGQAWAFEGNVGDTFTIDLMSDDFDCFLYVVGPGLDEPRSNDDGGEDLDSRLTLTLPADGTYRVIASALSISGGGNYSLRVTRADR